MKIVIPSHKRHDKVYAREVVTNPILCVSISQAAQYKEHNPGIEIVTHPDSVLGLLAKRQWCYDHFGDLWMIDDDVIKIIEVYDQNTTISPERARKALENIFDLAARLNVFLFGISNNPRPVQYRPQQPILLSGAVSGGCYGLRKESKHLNYKQKGFELVDDFWISLLNAYHYRKCLIDTRFVFIQKDTFKGKGGQAEYRNQITEEENYNNLKRYFGDAIVPKGANNKQSKPKTKFARTAKIPF